MAETKKNSPEKNKNNKTKPENLMNKEYLELLKELKKRNQERAKEDDPVFRSSYRFKPIEI